MPRRAAAHSFAGYSRTLRSAVFYPLYHKIREWDGQAVKGF